MRNSMAKEKPLTQKTLQQALKDNRTAFKRWERSVTEQWQTELRRRASLTPAERKREDDARRAKEAADDRAFNMWSGDPMGRYI